MVQEEYIIEKSNRLNQLRAKDMSVQELRFFSIYLSRINSRDVSTRLVRFNIEDFLALLSVKRVDFSSLRATASALLAHSVSIPLESGAGFKTIQLFKRFVCALDENDKWYIEIDAHDEALSLMFEFKERYFTYKLYNVLNLRSSNQIRLYEILKQYENQGRKVYSINELKALLGIDPNEYERYGNFKLYVLDACQSRINAMTDIKFEYRIYGKRGAKGKILKLEFIIEKNDDAPTTLIENFIADFCGDSLGEDAIGYGDVQSYIQERYKLIDAACNCEYSPNEIKLLYNIALKIMPAPPSEGEEQSHWNANLYIYTMNLYDEMNARSEKSPIGNRFGYLKRMLENQLDYSGVE